MFGPAEGDCGEEGPQCRICWAPDEADNLLSPCKCKGKAGGAAQEGVRAGRVLLGPGRLQRPFQVIASSPGSGLLPIGAGRVQALPPPPAAG